MPKRQRNFELRNWHSIASVGFRTRKTCDPRNLYDEYASRLRYLEDEIKIAVPIALLSDVSFARNKDPEDHWLTENTVLVPWREARLELNAIGKGVKYM